ncbi:MAG: ATP-binding protein [Promethearchaeota archaeon]
MATKREIIFRNREFFFKEKDYVSRDIEFINKIKSSLITVITGVRRSGKSILLKLIKDWLINNKKIKKKSIVYLDFDDPGIINFDLEKLESLFNTYFEEFYSKEKFIFLDEVQEIKNWHKLVLYFYKKGYKVIITGSNGNLLSKEIGTYLTGRTNNLKVYPFSFKEFLKLKNIKPDFKQKSNEKLIPLKKRFNEYMKKGGFPLVLKENDVSILKDYYENIINRDVLVRHNIINTATIKELSYYLITHFTQLSSYKSLKNNLNIKSLASLKDYLDFLEDSFLILPLKKFDYSLKKQIANPKKYYIIDTGLVNQIAYKFSENLGPLLENLVFLELKRKDYEIFYFKENKECDFVIQENNKITMAIQVCYDLNNQNKEREISGLKEAMKKFKLKKGILLTYDQEDEIDGIKVIPVWKWLLE